MLPISDHSDHILIGVVSFLSGGGILRVGVYVSNALPPLPATSGWWAKLFYNIVKGLSGVDPNAAAPLSSSASSASAASIASLTKQEPSAHV